MSHPFFSGVLLQGLLVLGSLSGLAYGKAAVTPLVTDGAEAPITLTVQVDVQPTGSESLRPVHPGETLHTGDRIGLRVEVDRSAYVKVLQIFPSGQSGVLFPMAGVSEEETRIEPGMQRALPFASRMFELDEETGVENLIVIASAQPLAMAAPDIQRYFVQLRKGQGGISGRGLGDAVAVSEGQVPPPPPPPPPPFPLTTADRSPHIRVPGKPYLLRVNSGRSGVAMLRFAFTHNGSAQTPSPRR